MLCEFIRFHRGVIEACAILGRYVAWASSRVPTFRYIGPILKKGEAAFLPWWTASVLKMGPICFPETSVINYQPAPRERYKKAKTSVCIVCCFRSLSRGKNQTTFVIATDCKVLVRVGVTPIARQTLQRRNNLAGGTHLIVTHVLRQECVRFSDTQSSGYLRQPYFARERSVKYDIETAHGVLSAAGGSD
jgi:hypothetical protein